MNCKRILLVLLLFPVVACFAKPEFPEWMNQQKRELMFPSSAYYTGFAVAEVKADETVEQALERLKQNAYGDLMSKISVSVRYHVTDTTREYVSTKEALRENVYSSYTSLKTRMAEIPGIEVKSFVDSQSKLAAMMAYVPKAGLADKLQRQLISQMARVNVRIEDADGFVASGNRSMAREAVDNARAALETAEDTRYTMLAIDNTLTAEELMDAEWRAAEMKIIALESELNRSVKVYLRCELEGKKENVDNSLYMMLSGELYRNGCTLTDSLSQAEFIVDVTASTAPFNKVDMVDYYFYYSYANATLVITKSDGSSVYSDKLSVKGSHTKNFEYASAKALRQLSEELGKVIASVAQK